MDDLLPIFSIIVSILSVYYAYKANDKSDEANQLSSKSIAINYDAIFNDFNIQLKRNIDAIRKLKEVFRRIEKHKTREFIEQTTRWTIDDVMELTTQKKYMRPSNYYSHYEDFESLADDIRAHCEVILKVLETSKEDNLFNDRIFLAKYNETLKHFDLIIKKLTETINNKV